MADRRNRSCETAPNGAARRGVQDRPVPASPRSSSDWFGVRYHPLTKLKWSCQKPEQRAQERTTLRPRRSVNTSGRGSKRGGRRPSYHRFPRPRRLFSASSLELRPTSRQSGRATEGVPYGQSDRSQKLVCLAVPGLTRSLSACGLFAIFPAEAAVYGRLRQRRPLEMCGAIEPQPTERRLNLRIGIGHDTHRLALGGPLRLGGLDIPHDHQAVWP